MTTTPKQLRTIEFSGAVWDVINNEAIRTKVSFNTALLNLFLPRPISEYHDFMGPVLWWCWEPPKAFEQISERVVSSAHDGRWLGEAPWCGTPNDLGQEVLIGTKVLTVKNGGTVKLEPYDGAGFQRIHVGGWPGYHTHWTPLPKVSAP